jgi:hypothetical protein
MQNQYILIPLDVGSFPKVRRSVEFATRVPPSRPLCFVEYIYLHEIDPNRGTPFHPTTPLRFGLSSALCADWRVVGGFPRASVASTVENTHREDGNGSWE